MAKLTSTMTFDIQGLDKVKTLVDLLSKYKPDLPKQLVESLEDLADCDECELSCQDIFAKFGTTKLRAFVDGVECKGVTSVNTVLKRVSFYTNFESHNAKETEHKKRSFPDLSTTYPVKFSITNESGDELMGW